MLPSVWFAYEVFKDILTNIIVIIYKKNIKVFRLITLNLINEKDFFKKHIADDCDDDEESGVEVNFDDDDGDKQ